MKATMDISINQNKTEKYAHVSYDVGSFSLFIHDPKPLMENDPDCMHVELTPEIARNIAKALIVGADFAEKMGVDE